MSGRRGDRRLGRGRGRFLSPALTLLLISPLRAESDEWKFRGFWESRVALYVAPQTRGNPVSEASSHFHGAVRYQNRYFSLVATPDLWIDTRRAIDRRSMTLSDRTDQRPIAAEGELYLDFAAVGLDFRLGKQQILWGRADTWNPTDNITPFDYLDLLDAERLGTVAVRVRRYFGASSLDMVWTPLFTPTRLPLPSGRWFPGGDPQSPGLAVTLLPARFPAVTAGNSQFALRWDQSRHAWDYSLSYFDGWNDLPDFEPAMPVTSFPSAPEVTQFPEVSLARSFRRIQVAGADFAGVLWGLGTRGEIALVHPEKRSPDATLADPRNYLLYAWGADERWGDWYLLGQWTADYTFGRPTLLPFPSSQAFTAPHFFTALAGARDTVRFPDRGFGHSLLARLERSVSPRSSWSVDALLSLSGGALLLRPEYEYQISQTWKIQLGAHILGGRSGEFLGQYRNNSRMYIKVKQSY